MDHMVREQLVSILKSVLVTVLEILVFSEICNIYRQEASDCDTRQTSQNGRPRQQSCGTGVANSSAYAETKHHRALRSQVMALFSLHWIGTVAAIVIERETKNDKSWKHFLIRQLTTVLAVTIIFSWRTFIFFLIS